MYLLTITRYYPTHVAQHQRRVDTEEHAKRITRYWAKQQAKGVCECHIVVEWI